MQDLPERAGPLPDEASLPPLDKPAWPLERIRQLLASRKPAGALWAVRRVAVHREPIEAAEIIDAVAFLLEHADDSVVERSLEALSGFAGHPAAREVAAAIAGRLPSFGEGTHEQELALEALGDLAPSDHVQAFADGLESGDMPVEIAALKGIAAGRSEGAPIILLGFMGLTSHGASAAVALAGLVSLREADLAERGAGVFLESFAGEKDLLLDALIEIDDAMGEAAGLFGRVEDSLYPADETPPPEERRRVLLPREDSAAARRADEIVGAERAGRILALADAGSHAELARLLGDLALQAIERASLENPAFGLLGRTLAGIVRTVLEWDGMQGLESEDQQIIASLIGTFLAKAVRGHDIARELDAAQGDRAKVLDLCRVDEAWVDEQAFERLARALGEEDLASLSRSPDLEVASRGQLLLAARDPRRYLRTEPAPLPLPRGLVRVAGDSVLPPIMDRVREEPAGRAIELLADAAQILGTERARVCAEHSIEALLGPKIPAAELLGIASATGSRTLAEKAIALVREGALDLKQAASFDLDLDNLKAEIETSLEVLEIPGDAEDILAEGWRESGGLLSDPEEHDDLFHEEDGEDEDGDSGWSDADSQEPVAPIVREGPKIGRNDPCPCGSGKKHKKCCGRVT